MPHCYIVAKDYRAPFVCVDGAVVLNVAAFSYFDLRTVAAQDRMEENRRVLSDGYVAEDH